MNVRKLANMYIYIHVYISYKCTFHNCLYLQKSNKHFLEA